MAIQQIPASNDFGAYVFRIDLEATTFTFAFRYNTRMSRWIWDVMDANGDPLVMGIPLLTLNNLIGRFKVSGLPLGDFILIDERGENINPERNDLGERVIMLYRESTT